MTLVRMNRPVSHMNRTHGYRTFSDVVNEMFNEEKVCTNQFVTSPPANVIESKFDFRIEIAAPGFEKSDFKIDLDKNLLTISLDKAVDENSEENFNLKEFNFNSFNRSFRVSDKINTEMVNAIYKNGLLQVMLPKREEAVEKPAREIKIS
ncbi:MAG: Hsp20/alpha crystallin family protein [Bacteroidales bacterium]|nr:Hsp20/alpha crystallin family protein [Bacteroidales bacterium]